MQTNIPLDVGDIESMPFIEALRQLSYRVGVLSLALAFFGLHRV